MLRDASAVDARTASGQAHRFGPRALASRYRQALVTNALNPKVAIFFLALLPQFIDAGASNKTLAFLFLGACFVAQGFVFLVLFALLVAPLRRWRPSQAWRRSLQAGGGLAVRRARRAAGLDRAVMTWA